MKSKSPILSGAIERMKTRLPTKSEWAGFDVPQELCTPEVTASPQAANVQPLKPELALDALVIAFVQGAQWWEYHKTGFTMWASDRDQAEGEAETKAANGTLGKAPPSQ